MRLSAIDRKILNCVQKDISFSSRPFKILSEKLRISEKELLGRLKQLSGDGIIRNFGASLNHKKLGFLSSLVAAKVPLDKVDSIAAKITEYPEVTHCYLRQGEYNLWIVFLCLKKRRWTQFLNNLTRWVGKENIMNLPTRKQYKLKTRLPI